MRRLDLDYLSDIQRAGWAGWMLLVAGVALAGEMGYSYFQAQRALSAATMQIRAAGTTLSRDAAPRQPTAPYAPAEFVKARETIARMSLPWGQAFKAVETIDSENIALLALEPDSQARTVTISGKARDFPALLTYIARLEETKPFSNVYLSRHEIAQNDPQRQISFSLIARWTI